MKQDIIDLIKSTHDDIAVYDELKKWIDRDVSVLSQTSIMKRTIFHLLVLYNRKITLQKLCENDYYRAFALERDNVGQTLLHLCVRQNESCREMLLYLIDTFPHLINTIDKYHYTPLDRALMTGQEWAANCLSIHHDKQIDVKNIDIHSSCLDDESNKLSVSLSAELNDLNAIKYQDTNKTIQSLNESFPFLMKLPKIPKSRSMPSSLSLSESYLNIPFPMLIHSENEVPPFEEKIFIDTNQQHNEKNSTSQHIQFLLMELVKTYHPFYLTPEYIVCRENLIKILCRTKDALPPDMLGQLFSTESHANIIANVLECLKPLVEDKYTDFQEKCFKLEVEFVAILNRLGLIYRGNNYHQGPDFDALKRTNLNLHALKTLWAMTLCEANINEEGEINPKMLVHQSIGLLTEISLHDLLHYLCLIYPYFSLHQKLVANYIVYKLSYYHMTCRFDKSLFNKLHFDYFLNFNQDKDYGLNVNYSANENTPRFKYGVILNKILSNLFILYDQFNDEAIIYHFDLLNKFIGQMAQYDAKKSFEKMTEEALIAKETEQDKYIQIIASDLKLLTIKLYAGLSFQDFNQSASGKLTTYFNYLCNYFVELILNQKPANVVNALRFIVRLAQILCPLNDKSYLDLNNLMLISSVLQHLSIARLTEYMDKLSAEEKGTIDDILKLVSNERNSKWMRELYRSYKFILPFPGLLLSDVTFAKEGNAKKHVAAYAVGSIIYLLLHVKITIQFHVHHAKTNLQYFLDHYKSMYDGNNEFYCREKTEYYADKQYQRSLRLQERKSDQVIFDKQTIRIHSLEGKKEYFIQNMIDIQLAINHINQCFLKNNVLPSGEYKNKKYTSCHLASNLINWLASQINHMKDYDFCLYDLCLMTNEIRTRQTPLAKNVLYVEQGESGLTYLTLGMDTVASINIKELDDSHVLNFPQIKYSKNAILRITSQRNHTIINIEQDVGEMFIQIKKTIKLIIDINNFHYYPSLNDSMINPLSFFGALNKLKESILKKIENNSSYIKNRHSQPVQQMKQNAFKLLRVQNKK